ncbi:MAG: hypothetical protein NVS9B2_05460 [Steroidobacteraceae bacterium]
MTTPLHSTLKRAVTIQGREYVVTLSSEALKVTLKGKRNGVELAWSSIVSGDAALAVALNASVGALGHPTQAARPPAGSRTRRSSTSKTGKRVPPQARTRS